VLLIRTGNVTVSPTGLSPCFVRLSSPLRLQLSTCLGLLRVRSPLLAESFLFLRVLRCFSSPGAPPTLMCSVWVMLAYPSMGFPIRTSPTDHGCTHLIGAFRSVPRPSSAQTAKASSIRPYLLLSNAVKTHVRYGELVLLNERWSIVRHMTFFPWVFTDLLQLNIAYSVVKVLCTEKKSGSSVCRSSHRSEPLAK
jgi:hypothetical protein